MIDLTFLVKVQTIHYTCTLKQTKIKLCFKLVHIILITSSDILFVTQEIIMISIPVLIVESIIEIFYKISKIVSYFNLIFLWKSKLDILFILLK